MKNSISQWLPIAVFMLSITAIFGQDFPMVWEGDFSLNAKEGTYINNDGSRILGNTNTQVSMLNGDGKEIWGGKFKDLSSNGVSNSDYRYCAWGPKVYFVFDKKAGADRVTVLDTDTGKELWTSERYQKITLDNIEYIEELESFLLSLKDRLVMIKARTGEEIWETDRFKGSIGKYLYLADKREIIMINFKPTLLGAFFSAFKNQFVRINADNGSIIWDASYQGYPEKKVITREPLVNITKVDDKIFLFLDGLQVFDYNTGENIWSAVYSMDPAARKGFVKGVLPGKIYAAGVYDAIAEPLFEGDHVYLALGDDKGKNKYIQKLNIETGEIVWTSEKIDKANAMPAIKKVGNTIVGQIGGLVNVQGRGQYKSGDQLVNYRISAYEWYGKFGLVGIDDSNGQYVWRSEKFKKRITNIISDGEVVYAASGVEFYALDPHTGEPKYSVDHKRAGVGKPYKGFDYADKIVMVCDNGVVGFSKADGKELFKTDKFKGITNFYEVGKNFFIQNSKNDKLAGVDLETGEIKGVIKAKGKGEGSVYGAGIDITSDGEYIYWFKGKSVEKYKVN